MGATMQMETAASTSSKEVTESENMLQDMTNEQLDKAVRGLDRPLLLKTLELDFKLSPVVEDMHELKPISLYVKKQMTVHSMLLPFVNTVTAVDFAL